MNASAGRSRQILATATVLEGPRPEIISATTDHPSGFPILIENLFETLDVVSNRLGLVFTEAGDALVVWWFACRFSLG